MFLRVIIDNDDFQTAVEVTNRLGIKGFTQTMYDYFDVSLNKYAFFCAPSHAVYEFAKLFNTDVRVID